jgi:hypothetical protein
VVNYGIVDGVDEVPWLLAYAGKDALNIGLQVPGFSTRVRTSP